MLITAIEPRRKSLRALYLDGELAVNIDAQTLLSSRFQVGTEITDEELHELLAASDANRAKEKALYLIAHRDHSKKELVDKIRRTASQEAAEKAAAPSCGTGRNMIKSPPQDIRGDVHVPLYFL